MPTYTYKCNNCKKTFEQTHRMTERPTFICPECKDTELVKVPSAPNGLHFKGTGFYETDYKNKF